MKVVRAFAVVGLALSSAACPSSPPPKAIPVALARDVVPFIQAAHLTKPVAFDGGSLRLDPIQGTPNLSEQKALRTWIYTTELGWPGGVVVVFARATIRIPISVEQNSTVRPSAVPVFRNRPAWAIFSYNGGPVSCPGETASTGRTKRPKPSASSTPRVVKPSQSVELLATDGTNEGVVYQSAGLAGTCGQEEAGARASVASYIVSAPRRIGAAGNPHTSVIVSVPSCASLWAVEGPEGLPGKLVYKILMRKLMVTPPCLNDRTSQTLDYVRSRGPFGNPSLTGIAHAPPGPTLYSFLPPKIQYFDGAKETLQTS